MNKINKSITFDGDVHSLGRKYAKTKYRSFSWYVNNLVKKDLIAKKLITEPLNIE